MYKTFIARASLIVTFCSLCAVTDPFAVVLMVKDEEQVITKTLDPYVEAGITSFLIFDTGSTDNTISTVQAYFKKHDIDGHIAIESFIDFATSRNHALEVAEEYFPEIPFFLMPDAEWYLHNVEGLSTFCWEHITDSCNCYIVKIEKYGLDFSVPRLIRARTNTRFVGVVHESIVADYKKVPSNIYFELGFSKNGMHKSQQRWQRDLKLLLKKYEEDPLDTRNLFYLAQTYECLQDYENAYLFYEKRSQLPGWPEEDFETFYRLGRVTMLLSRDHSEFTWHQAQDYYFKAHQILPQRAEPLVRLAEYYWPDNESPRNAALCYLFAKRAYEMAYPTDALLFIDPEVYHFKRHELLSKSAWHIKDYELGEAATRKALAYRELPYLLRNLAWYLEKKY